MDKVGYVYFIPLTLADDEGEDVDYVKIGFSEDPTRRLYTLQTSLPIDLEVETYFPGTKEDEKEIHRRLKKHRVRREWYRSESGGDVEEFIADLVDARWLLRGEHGEDYDPTIRECMGYENAQQKFNEVFTALTDKAKEMGVWPFEPEPPPV